MSTSLLLISIAHLTPEQAFFSYRVWKLSGRVWLAIPPWIVALARFGFSMAVIALLVQNGLAEFQAHRYLGDLALILSMVVGTFSPHMYVPRS
jgi:hypothetical protein